MFADPVSGERFFDRTAILELLNKRASALASGYRQNIALIGRELMGKTSIIKQFIKTIESDLLLFYIELRDEEFSEFAKRFLGAILYKYLKSHGVRPKGTLQELIKQANRHIPKTAELVSSALESVNANAYEEGFSKILDLFSSLKDESGKCVLIVFDEFHNLERMGLPNPFYTLGNKIMVQRDIMYIITSSSIQVARKLIEDKLSLLFGNFETVEVGPFELAAAYDFLARRLGEGKKDNIYLWYLVSLVNASPFYLDVISDRLEENLRRNPEGDYKELVILTLSELLFNAQGILSHHFIGLVSKIRLEKNYGAYLWVLTQVALGRNKASSIEPQPCMPIRDATRYLNKWVELGILHKNGVFYKFDDALFKFWLKNVYASRSMSFDDDMKTTLNEFTDAVSSNIAEFVDESRKDPAIRIKELFKSFSGEIAEVNDKRMQFPRFSNLEIRVKEGPLVLARDGNRYWALHIEEAALSEGDVLEFARRCAVANGRYHKKILIALDEIDLNAKLLAKENGFQIWSTPALNELLDIFGKHKMIPKMTR